MLVETKNGKKVYLRTLQPGDFDNLYNYLQNLSADTKRRFGPHRFDKQSIIDFYEQPDVYKGYVAVDITTNGIIAYSIIKIGYLEHDKDRLQSYGLLPDGHTDCTFAPSVADAWQSRGIGNKLFHFILASLKEAGIKRIILWGGVQADNSKAVHYYQKNKFKLLGQFTYNGENYDMVLEIASSSIT